jgi:uncharacterized protein YdhG (YjbR/CyaY superfamily)
MKGRSQEVDEYIANASKSAQAKLTQVRKAILDVAPDAEESISYRIPYYSYKGSLAWFGLFRAHIGLYIRPPVVEKHRRKLAGYETTKSAVHLPLEKDVPVRLIQTLVRARVKMNEAEETSGKAAGRSGARRTAR